MINIVSNNFSSISFDMSAIFILKYLDFNSLPSWSIRSSCFFNDFICASNDFDLSIILSRWLFNSFIICFDSLFHHHLHLMTLMFCHFHYHSHLHSHFHLHSHLHSHFQFHHLFDFLILVFYQLKFRQIVE